MGRISKESGGERAIALLVWLSRFWGPLRNDIPRECMDGKAGLRDEAIRASSVLRASVSSHYMDESCDALGISHGSILFDVAEF